MKQITRKLIIVKVKKELRMKVQYKSLNSERYIQKRKRLDQIGLYISHSQIK